MNASLIERRISCIVRAIGLILEYDVIPLGRGGDVIYRDEAVAHHLYCFCWKHWVEGTAEVSPDS